MYKQFFESNQEVRQYGKKKYYVIESETEDASYSLVSTLVDNPKYDFIFVVEEKGNVRNSVFVPRDVVKRSAEEIALSNLSKFYKIPKHIITNWKSMPEYLNCVFA